MARGFHSCWLFLLLYWLFWRHVLTAKPVVNIGVVFHQSEYAEYAASLRTVETRVNTNADDDFETSISSIGVEDSPNTIRQICAVIERDNWAVMLVVGDVNTVKETAFIGDVLGIPTIGYTNLGRSVPATVRLVLSET
jgi:hypothetical protein